MRRSWPTAQGWVALGRARTAAGIVADSMGDAQSQRRAFEPAIKFARLAGATMAEVHYLANLSDACLKSGDHATALDKTELALALAREIHDVSCETIALANIGLAQISMRHFDAGKRRVREAMAIDERRGSVTGVSDTTRELGLYLEKAGDLPDAIAAHHAHWRLANTLLRDGQQKAILAMQEQYDAEQRARALKPLGSERSLKAEQLRRRDLEQQLWWLLAAASALSLSVIALLYRRMHQSKRLLTRSNAALKLQSEIDPLTGLANRRRFQTAMRELAADGKLDGTVGNGPRSPERARTGRIETRVATV